jgi:hypothetical protein
MLGSLKKNTTLEYSTRVVQEGDRRCEKSTLNDLAYLTPLRIPLMNPVYVTQLLTISNGTATNIKPPNACLSSSLPITYLSVKLSRCQLPSCLISCCLSFDCLSRFPGSEFVFPLLRVVAFSSLSQNACSVACQVPWMSLGLFFFFRAHLFLHAHHISVVSCPHIAKFLYFCQFSFFNTLFLIPVLFPAYYLPLLPFGFPAFCL